MLGLKIVKFNYRRSKPSLSLILTEPFPSLAITFCVSNLFRPVAQSHSSNQTRACASRSNSTVHTNTYREQNEWLRSLTFCGKTSWWHLLPLQTGRSCAQCLMRGRSMRSSVNQRWVIWHLCREQHFWRLLPTLARNPLSQHVQMTLAECRTSSTKLLAEVSKH